MMHNIDREMLELAAFAVGIVGEWVEDSNLDDYYKSPTTGILTQSEGRTHIWNAETSSGDALRLANKLKIVISYSSVCGTLPNCAIIASYTTKARYGSSKHVSVEYIAEDLFSSKSDDDRRYAEYQKTIMGVVIGIDAATRRAIVRAAAEIGREIKNGEVK